LPASPSPRRWATCRQPILERFSTIVREATSGWDGRLVKQIGDAFMLIFPEPRSAVACALEIATQAAGEPQFPAVRGGIHWGSVLYRDGDYVGSNVNIASRLATEADRHQILVTGDVRKKRADSKASSSCVLASVA
jgi:class 3 adenylate cyclase